MLQSKAPSAHAPRAFQPLGQPLTCCTTSNEAATRHRRCSSFCSTTTASKSSSSVSAGGQGGAGGQDCLIVFECMMPCPKTASHNMPCRVDAPTCYTGILSGCRDEKHRPSSRLSFWPHLGSRRAPPPACAGAAAAGRSPPLPA